MKLVDVLPVPPVQGFTTIELSDAHQEHLDMIDGALMRRGTLSAEGVDWNSIEKTCVCVLCELPHLGALRGLVVARWQLTDGRDPADLVDLAERVVGSYWEYLLPSGPNRQRLRTAWLDECLKLLREIIERHIIDIPYAAEALQAPAKRLRDATNKRDIEWQGAPNLISNLRAPESAVSRGVETPPANTEIESAANTPLDARGRAALHRDIIALADRISHHNAEADVAFAMRRYATWMGMNDAPPADDKGRIERMGLPSVLVREMEALAAGGGAEGLRKIENRLLLSPYWFAGQRLAAEMAERLGFSDIAQTISRKAARQFKRAPKLAGLSYSNGDPLIDPETKAWLECVGSPKETSTSGPEIIFSDVPKESSNGPGDFDELIVAIENRPEDLRSKAKLKFALAIALRSRGHLETANVLFEELKETLSDSILSNWDRVFAEEIADLLGRNSA